MSKFHCKYSSNLPKFIQFTFASKAPKPLHETLPSSVLQLEPLYTRGEKPWVEKFQPMGGLETEKPKECHFTPEIFSTRDKGGENDVNNTFFLLGTKNAHFLRPLEIASSWTWCEFQGAVWPKILQPINFSILENILKISTFHVVASSHFTLHPKAIKFKVWLLKDEPWPLCNFLHGFSPIV